MTLRTKLILAFLGLSVVPLGLVTLFSYQSSLRAFHRAVEAESDVVAAEMGRRIEFVTADLGRRMDQLVELPARQADASAEEVPIVAARVLRTPAHVAPILGEAAAFLERLEFVPSVPDRPELPAAARARASARAPQPPRARSPRHPVPAPPPAPPAPAVAPTPAVAAVPAPEKIVVDLERVLADVRAAAAESGNPELADTLLKAIETGVTVGVKGAAIGLRAGADALAREIERKAEATRQKAAAKAALAGGSLEVPVRHGGKLVGKVNAKLDLDRMLTTALAVTRTDKGEIPFAVDARRQVYTPDPADRVRVKTLVAGASPRQPVRVGDWLVVTRQDPSGLTFGIAKPIGESLRELRRAAGRNLALGLLMIGVALIGVMPLSERMTRNLRTLNAGVERIAKGDYSARVPVRSRDEFGSLADAFNRMAHDVEAHQKLVVEQERMHRELELCRQIQSEMLPKDRLRLGLAEVRGVSIPAREVGGDFFNYFLLPGGEIALLVGDVSGKGVSAALLMAKVQALLRARLPLEPDLPQLIDIVDREIEASTPGGVYVTLFAGVLDPATKMLRFVNAGHNPQFVLRAGGGLERLASTGLPVGLYAGHGYSERSLTLADGDLLFFYTDGMVEAENEAGDMFSAERLEALLVAEHEKSVDEVLERVERAVREFRGKAEPFDDATMMALRMDVASKAALV
jgi:serine phosphatase RsbU (regulator of sigma subunit)